jgi:hypothetical protein
MSQISPPIRIVLVAAVAFLAAWMLILRPKTEEIPPPEPAAAAPAKQPGTTAQSAAGKAVQAAVNAKATAESAAKARAGESAPQTAPAATTAAGPAPAAKAAADKLGVEPSALASLPLGVQKALQARQIVVLGFFNRAALDDRLTQKQLEKVHRFHGRVYVHAAKLQKVQRYQVITRGADVSQTPSVVVIDRNMKAQLLTGYVDHVRVEQAIVDAMRRSDMAVVKAPYLRKVNALCGSYSGSLAVALEPGADGTSRSSLRENTKVADRLAARFSAVKAPKAYKSFRKQWLADLRLTSQADHAVLAAMNAHSLDRILGALDKYEKPLAKAGKRLRKSSRQHDMLACMYG